MPHDVLFEAAGSLQPLYESLDWSATAVGPPSSWRPALVNALDNALHTRFPVTLFWGPEFVLLYNEAFVELIADKHPTALGRPAREVFPEAWTTIGPLMQDVLAGAGPTWVKDAPVPLRRRGILDEAYFTFSYSPIRGAGGAIEGVMDIAIETTVEVVNQRRGDLLRTLDQDLAAVQDRDELPARVLATLLRDPRDVPVADLRLTDASPPAGEPMPDPCVIEDRDGQRIVWLSLDAPAGRDGARATWLVVELTERRPVDDVYLGFLASIAAAVAQALRRLEARDIERRMSETLQRSLLTTPIQPDHLAVAVRYAPATQEAQVGGDWYDCFLLSDGSLTLVIGDVAGHDRHAAAAMAQVRNLLRGVAYAVRKPPAEVLGVLDGAMHDLAVDVVATAVVARVEQSEADAQRGLRTLRWSNAGHPPPVLLGPDGTARLLEARPDPLLGFNLTERSDHTAVLEPGSSVIFYTDGLVERRDIPLPERFAWLTDTLTGRHQLSAEELCEHLLAQLGTRGEDDVALMVLRAHSEQGPRPAEAGEAVLPSDLRTDTV